MKFRDAMQEAGENKKKKNKYKEQSKKERIKAVQGPRPEHSPFA